MTVRLIAVVLRLSALYFLWWTINFFGLYQFALYSEEGPVLGFVIAIATFLLIAGAL